MNDPPGPRLSVVVVTLGDGTELRSLLAALHRTAGEDTEVILPAPPRVQAVMGEAGPRVRVLPLGDEHDDPWRMRAAGAVYSRGEIVATLEDHVVPVADWRERLLTAHDIVPAAAIGGAIAKATPDTATGWAMYFFDYGRYAPPLAPGSREYLSACNVSYKRAALERLDPAWRESMHETTVHFALQRAGESLWLDPAILVRQRRNLTLTRALRELRRHGESFGRDRAVGLGAAQRRLRSLALPAIAAVQLARTVLPVRRAPSLLFGWLRALPALLLMCVAWATGEVRGLAAGSPEPRA